MRLPGAAGISSVRSSVNAVSDERESLGVEQQDLDLAARPSSRCRREPELDPFQNEAGLRQRGVAPGGDVRDRRHEVRRRDGLAAPDRDEAGDDEASTARGRRRRRSRRSGRARLHVVAFPRDPDSPQAADAVGVAHDGVGAAALREGDGVGRSARTPPRCGRGGRGAARTRGRLLRRGSRRPARAMRPGTRDGPKPRAKPSEISTAAPSAGPYSRPRRTRSRQRRPRRTRRSAAASGAAPRAPRTSRRPVPGPSRDAIARTSAGEAEEGSSGAGTSGSGSGSELGGNLRAREQAAAEERRRERGRDRAALARGGFEHDAARDPREEVGAGRRRCRRRRRRCGRSGLAASDRAAARSVPGVARKIATIASQHAPVMIRQNECGSADRRSRGASSGSVFGIRVAEGVDRVAESSGQRRVGSVGVAHRGAELLGQARDQVRARRVVARGADHVGIEHGLGQGAEDRREIPEGLVEGGDLEMGSVPEIRPHRVEDRVSLFVGRDVRALAREDDGLRLRIDAAEEVQGLAVVERVEVLARDRDRRQDRAGIPDPRSRKPARPEALAPVQRERELPVEELGRARRVGRAGGGALPSMRKAHGPVAVACGGSTSTRRSPRAAGSSRYTWMRGRSADFMGARLDLAKLYQCGYPFRHATISRGDVRRPHRVRSRRAGEAGEAGEEERPGRSRSPTACRRSCPATPPRRRTRCPTPTRTRWASSPRSRGSSSGSRARR